ncbi:MAG: alpha/beta hydrolase-fold protein [Eubacteriales bacterium]
MKTKPRRRKIKIIIGVAIVVLAIAALMALRDVVESVYIGLHYNGDYESFEVQSDIANDTYVIHVYLPDDYDPTIAYPTIFVLDGDSDGRPMAGVAAMTDLDAIVFGVGYGSADEDARERDYTPFVADVVDWAPTGGGEEFYAFMKEELIPEVESRYLTQGNKHRVLAGHSLAGLATVYALLNSSQDEALFAGYIAASPTLPLQENAIFDIEKTLSLNKTDIPAVLYLSIGGRESDEMQQAMYDMASTLNANAYPSLTIYTFSRKGRGHGGNNWLSYLDGIRFMQESGVF